jgi:hypothetical protein
MKFIVTRCCKYLSLYGHFFILVSFNIKNEDANRLGYARIYSKCNLKEWRLKDFVIISFEH